jgi:sterol desaturase/sphingolipid hydroxylase (fatty acid hydroxylase superfamily)
MVFTLGAMQAHAGPADFLVLTGMVTIALVIVLAVTAQVFAVLQRRNPANRIQPGRAQLARTEELRRAPISILIIALCFAGGLFAQWQGWALTPLPLSWWSAPVTFVASLILYDAWFYWVHRLLHSRPFLRFHTPHHRAKAPTVWTNHNETPVEALLNQAFYVLIVFVLPIPWQMLIVQKLYDQISGMLGHCGYEHFASPMARAPWPLASTVFHDNHHRYFGYNFAHSFSVWDRLMGTLHRDYDETVRGFEPAPPVER